MILYLSGYSKQGVILDQDVRAAFDQLHGRVNDLKERVVLVEAQQPHINTALSRIEKSVEKINGHITKAVWLGVAAFIMMILRFALQGGFHIGG